jgi:hypothetical protein
MQLVPRYLVTNRINIVADVAGFVTEYRPVYNRQIQLYKGVDNVIEFKVLNADQKAVDISSYTPTVYAFGEDKTLLIEKQGVVSATKGVFTVTITESDLLNIKQQYLGYNVLLNTDSGKTLTYAHSNFDNDATMFINARTMPGPLATYEVTQFAETSVNSDVWVSESITAQPAINGNEALHTAAVYTDGYTGDVTVQATLDNQVTDNTVWANVSTLTFTGSETQPTPVNFNGVYSYLRFKTDADPANTITKVLVRN